MRLGKELDSIREDVLVLFHFANLAHDLAVHRKPPVEATVRIAGCIFLALPFQDERLGEVDCEWEIKVVFDLVVEYADIIWVDHEFFGPEIYLSPGLLSLLL